MKLKSDKKLYSKLLLITLAIVLIASATYLYFRNNNKNVADTKNANDNTLESGKKDIATENNTPANSGTPSAKQDPSTTPEGSTGTAAPSKVIISITNASQQGQYVAIRAIAEGTNTGTCRLELTKTGSSTIVKEAPLSVQASYVICQGFNVPTSEFSSAGQWNAAIKLTAANGVTASDTKTIEVTK